MHGTGECFHGKAVCEDCMSERVMSFTEDVRAEMHKAIESSKAAVARIEEAEQVVEILANKTDRDRMLEIFSGVGVKWKSWYPPFCSEAEKKTCQWITVAHAPGVASRGSERWIVFMFSNTGKFEGMMSDD